MKPEIADRLKFLKFIVHHTGSAADLIGVCGGYESKKWRYEQFATWLFEDHLTDFALKYSEYELISYKNAAKKLAAAAKTIFTSQNPNRGEFGELILHGLIKEVYETRPVISKIYFKDAPNDTVKGFDAVHVVEKEGQLELWLGEVKFYNNITNAIRDVIPEIKGHFENDYLRREFAAIVNKLDKAWPLYTRLLKLIDPNTSLDEIFDCICVPVLLTYDSDVVSRHREFTEDYKKELTAELKVAYNTFMSSLSCPVKVHLFLLPLESKVTLSNQLIAKLDIWQKI